MNSNKHINKEPNILEKDVREHLLMFYFWNIAKPYILEVFTNETRTMHHPLLPVIRSLILYVGEVYWLPWFEHIDDSHHPIEAAASILMKCNKGYYENIDIDRTEIEYHVKLIDQYIDSASNTIHKKPITFTISEQEDIDSANQAFRIYHEIIKLKKIYPSHISQIDEKWRDGFGPSDIEATIRKSIGYQYLFIREGDFWTIVFSGNKLPPQKHMDGFTYIQQLLMNPNKEYSVLDLFHAVKNADVFTDSSTIKGSVHDCVDGEEMNLHTESSFEPLDDHAKRDYVARLQFLHTKRKEAEAIDDLSAIEQIDQDCEMLEQQLTEAHFQKMKGNTHEEKTRKNVSRRIKVCIEKLAANNSELGQHLITFIKTGAKCSYSPIPPSVYKWHF